MGWVPMEAALARATAQRTAVAGGSLRLYQDTLVPDASTTKAQYEAAKATFDNYADITVAAWFAPGLAVGEGYSITMPSQQFGQGAADPLTPNVIRGYYYLSAGGALMYAGRFGQDVPIAVANAVLDVEITDKFLTGS